MHDDNKDGIRRGRGANSRNPYFSTAGSTAEIARRENDAHHGERFTVGAAPPKKLRNDPENRAYRDAITGGAFKKNEFI
jgi:hypothetical protein